MLASGRLLNSGRAGGDPSFVTSCSPTDQVLARLGHLKLCPEVLDVLVACLHLLALGAELTKLSKVQADCAGIEGAAAAPSPPPPAPPAAGQDALQPAPPVVGPGLLF